MRGLIVLSLALILSACAPPGGRDYINALTKMIHAADRIVVTEHSCELDWDEQEDTSLIPKEISYRTRELTLEQKNLFQTTIEGLSPKTQDAFPSCIFEPHHTISFYAGGSLVSQMRICFRCGQVVWGGTKATPPWSLPDGLRSFIQSIGLEPTRDWEPLAREHLGKRHADAAAE